MGRQYDSRSIKEKSLHTAQARVHHYSDNMMYSQILVLLLATSVISSTPTRSNTTCYVYSKPGDVTFSGVFQFKESTVDGFCASTEVSYRNLMMSEAMMWAINEINDREDILQNINIGYELRDGCGVEDISLWSALSFFTDTCSSTQGHRDRVNLVAMVTASPSYTTIWMTKVADLFHVPMVSGSASSDELSDTVRFPYFFRTVPPDRFQVDAMVDILIKFDWRYIGLIYTADTYGLHGARQIKTAAERAGVCIAMSAAIQPSAYQDELEETIDKLIKVPKAKVVILFAFYRIADALFLMLRDKNLDLGITWIGSDGWGFGYESNPELADVTAGSIFVRPNIFRVRTPKFERYLAERDPDIYPGSPWYNEFWRQRKETLGCSDFTQCPLYGEASASVINSVDALAHALHSMYTDSCLSGQCLSPKDISGELFKQYLLNVSFQGTDGLFEFDDLGDTLGKYQILNLQKHGHAYSMIQIGYWDARLAGGPPLRLHEEEIQFVNNDTNTPFSLCIEQCRYGYITIPLEEKCCYGCQRCPDNAIVVNNETTCQECPMTHWPDVTHTICRLIPPTAVDLRDPIILAILVASSLGLLLCLVTAIGMWINRNHPLIKATSRELSAVNLFGVAAAFFDVFLLLIRPSAVLCPVAESMISLCFTVMFAPTLLKIIRIHRIFKAGQKSAKRPRFVSVPDQVAMISVLISIQVWIILITVLGIFRKKN